MGLIPLFNGGSVPMPDPGNWGGGVVQPGAYIEVDEAVADSYTPPWTRDLEAERSLAELPDTQPVATPAETPQETPQAAPSADEGNPPSAVVEAVTSELAAVIAQTATTQETSGPISGETTPATGTTQEN